MLSVCGCHQIFQIIQLLKIDQLLNKIQMLSVGGCHQIFQIIQLLKNNQLLKINSVVIRMRMQSDFSDYSVVEK